MRPWLSPVRRRNKPAWFQITGCELARSVSGRMEICLNGSQARPICESGLVSKL